MTHTIVKPISLTPIHTELGISQFGVEPNPATLEVVMINSLSSESSELFSYSCMVPILYTSMLMLPTQVIQH